MGGVTVAGITFQILQNQGCGASFTQPGTTVDSTAQTLSVAVTAGSCSWPAVSNVSWMTVTTPSLETGNATVSIQVTVNNTNATRTGTVTIGVNTYTVTQRQTAAVFADVGVTDPFFDAVNLMSSMSITTGCSTNPLSYCPNANVSRGQMAVFIVRAVMGGDNFSYSAAPYFNDVGTGNIYYRWIQKMRELGITTGCGTNLFCPNDPVTRAQMAVFVIRARYGADAAFTYSSTPLFTDVGAANTYFPWIQKMDQVGITTGCGAGLYCPDGLVTRAQMAVFVVRGAFNELLASGSPVVASISPATLSPGTTGTVTITGLNTNFVISTSLVTAGDGITVSNVNVSTGTSLTVQFTVDANAALGPRSIVVTTGPEEAALPNGFQVH
jgi:hypothetical protein